MNAVEDLNLHLAGTTFVPKRGYNSCMADRTIALLGELAAHRWGLFTTSDAEAAGVRRKQLTRMAASGAIERLAQGVYRMAGSPEHPHERVLVAWLALGGHHGSPSSVPPVVAAGETAADLHGLGDFFVDELDFIVPQRKGTRVGSIRLRVRSIDRRDVQFVDGVPALKVERLIADLIEIRTEQSLVADVIEQAASSGKLTSIRQLEKHLAPLARRYGHAPNDGASFREELYDMAGVTT